jgi:Pirin C-terminal cupin domain
MKRRSAVRGASGGKGTLDLRVLTYMPLVPLIAEHVCRQVAQPVDLGNLIKDGIAGLIEAARIYTPQSSVPFGIYVKHRIKGAILDGLLSGTASPPSLSSKALIIAACHECNLSVELAHTFTSKVFLLVLGKPLEEPVAGYGPIVMNTQEQLPAVVFVGLRLKPGRTSTSPAWAVAGAGSEIN